MITAALLMLLVCFYFSGGDFMFPVPAFELESLEKQSPGLVSARGNSFAYCFLSTSHFSIFKIATVVYL